MHSSMTPTEFDILRSEEVRRSINDNIEGDPARIALNERMPHHSLVATQVKYLQRARRKLPSLYEARCIIPPRAFEQSSSEESALRKHLSGESALDLTCGLGIDALALSKHFQSVVAIERDENLAEVVRYNMSLLKSDNVQIVTSTAEEYVADTTEHFDWVFIDPDRRSTEGNKMVCMEDCSPNVLSLMPRLSDIASRVAIKLSPMFDCAEAFRLLSPAEVEIVSWGGECKEVNIYTGADSNLLRIAVIGDGEWTFAPEDMSAQPTSEEFKPEEYRFLLVPDVALQKGRVAIAALRDHASIWSNNGYAFARNIPTERLPVRLFEIESIEPYRPKELKRRLRGTGVEFMKRDTALSIEAVRRATGTKAGNEKLIAFTTINNHTWIINLKK